MGGRRGEKGGGESESSIFYQVFFFLLFCFVLFYRVQRSLRDVIGWADTMTLPLLIDPFNFVAASLSMGSLERR